MITYELSFSSKKILVENKLTKGNESRERNCVADGYTLYDGYYRFLETIMHRKSSRAELYFASLHGTYRDDFRKYVSKGEQILTWEKIFQTNT